MQKSNSLMTMSADSFTSPGCIAPEGTKMKIYMKADGKIIMRMKLGTIPDRSTLERVSDIMRNHRKEAVA